MLKLQRSLLATLVIVVVPHFAAAQSETGPVESVGDFIVHTRDENIAPFVRYCVETLPELEEPLEADYQAFSVRLTEAAQEFRRRLADRKYLNATMPTDLAVSMRGMLEGRLEQVKTQDPRIYCQGLRENIATWTVETLAKNFEEQFVRLEAIQSMQAGRRKSR
jgi:hypothetical protein